jgi:TatD DNase family protein
MSKRPEYIDIHSHVNFAVFDVDRDAVVRRALDSGTWMINVGTKQDTSRRAVEMTQKYPEGVYAIIGLHPIHVNPSHHDSEESCLPAQAGDEGKTVELKGEDFDVDFYRSLAREGGRKVVAIGECGLDYYRNPTEMERQRQITAFRAQIELALALDLPLMLHIRSAYREVLDILAEYKGEAGAKLRGDAHFFAGSVDDAREFLALGFHLSYTGVITFPPQKGRAGAISYIELIQATPIDRIMSETDCPYVTPVPHRGKRCEPVFVQEVAHKIAAIKDMSIDECKKSLVDNALKLFRL